MKKRGGVLNLFTFIFFVCLSLLVIEIGVRLIFPKISWQFRDFTSDWQLDKVLGWVQKPNLDVSERTDFGWIVRFQTNEDGLTPATAQRTKTNNRMRIMIFGDSIVVGRSVPQDKTISAQLEQLLQSKNINAEVINAGVQGYATDQTLLRMIQLLPLYKPDIAIYGLCQNDFWENQTSEAHGQAKPVYKILEHGEIEMVPPVLKDKIYSGGSGPRKWIQYSALYRYLQPGFFKLRMMLGRWNSQNAVVPEGLDEFYYNKESLKIINWQLFRYLLKQMEMVAKANGAQFIFYAHPALQEVWKPYIKNIEKILKLKPGQYDKYAIESQLTRIANEDNILFIPMINWFWKHESEGPFHLLPRDAHSNQNGYRLIAENLCRYCCTFSTNKREFAQ
jgi:lysophospholipase L1-like esterase